MKTIKLLYYMYIWSYQYKVKFLHNITFYTATHVHVDNCFTVWSLYKNVLATARNDLLLNSTCIHIANGDVKV